jgi:Na+/H+-dicarboxylate symporter
MTSPTAEAPGAGDPAPHSPAAPAAPTPPLLLWLIVSGAVGGALAGALFGEPAAAAFGWMGDLFLDALRMVVIPLVMASLVCGIAAIGDIRGLGRAGLVAVVYFLATMALAVVLGLVLVSVFEPGAGLGGGTLTAEQAARFESKGEIGPVDLARSFVHPSLVDAMAKSMILPCIVFSLAFGAALTTLGSRGRAVLAVVEGVNEAMMKVVGWLMWVAPLGILGLVAGRIGATGGGAAAVEEFRRILDYVGVVLLGLAIHGVVVLPLLLRFLGRRAPLPFARGMVPALLTAFSTASSSATLPVTLSCVTGANGVSARAANFLAPLGATLNMNGTALYEAVAAVFIAQAHGLSLDAGSLVVVALLSVLAAIGAAGIPEAGLVTMVLVLQAVGLPLEGLGLILAVDWFLDRCRTTVNVWDDGVGSAVLERLAFGRGRGAAG